MRVLPAAVVAALFAALSAQTWRRWSDPVIDFGAEVYLPWRLALGDRLYADLAYRNGPLSPHVNALWFRLFGPSVEALALANLVLLAALCAVVWRLFAPVDRTTRALVCSALLVAFGFAHLAPNANYNWVLPYQHAQTHGVLLGLAGVAALGAALRSGAARAWGAAGLSLGLAFLTKAELFVPAAAAAAAAVALARAGAPQARAGRGFAVLVAAALAPPLAALALLAARMPADVALGGVLGNWRYLGAALADDPFYRSGAGLGAPAANVLAAARSLAAVALALGAVLAADRALARHPRRRALGAALAAGLFAVLAALGPRVPWVEVARALPLTTAAGGVALLFAWQRTGGDPARRAELAALLVLAVYALALLGKMLLHARFGHYGFALALPATLLLAAGAVAGTAALAARRPGGGDVARALAAALVVAALLGLWRHSAGHYARKDFVLGAGADAIVVERERGARVAEALRRLEALAPPDATLLALPEGLSMNYWLRRRNPSRFWLFLPTELDAVGEEAILADLRAHPPDFVALVDRSYGGMGVGPFGRDPRSGPRLAELVRAEYEAVGQVGPEPFRGEGFGITLLARRPRPDAPQRPPPDQTSP